MNLQQAKALAIEEGNVKTIHDKNNQLLWGAVGYDVKYKGDTTQASYSGKNLFGGLTYATKSYVGSWSLENNILTITPSAADRNPGITFALGSSLPAGTYTLNSNNFISSATQLRESASSMGGGANFNQYYSEVTRTTTATTPYVTFNWMATGSLDPFTVDLSTLQIEAGSTATSYEPYVGGIPAPNPSYPQTVNVVTGTQTITLTDGVVSDDFTLSLGTTELCKIGTYQDYIYKSGDDWYVHKVIGKVVLDGTEETWSRLVISGVTRFFTVDEPDALIITNSSVLSPIISNYFTSQTPSNVYTAAVPYGISLSSGTAKFRIRNKDFSEVADFKTWLSTHNTAVYYALATHTDTQITDATLIGQLDAIHQFLTRYGYNSNVSGNLPIIIDKTSLS